MNFFCRLLGHTWTHQVDEPEIVWTTHAKTLSELVPTVRGEPRFYRRCARCKLEEDVEPPRTGASGDGAAKRDREDGSASSARAEDDTAAA